MKAEFTRIDTATGREYAAHTIVPEPTPNPGTASKKFKTPLAEFHARYCSGRQHRKSAGSIAKLETAARHMSAYFQKYDGLHSFSAITPEAWARFVEHLKFLPSLLDTRTTEIKRGSATFTKADPRVLADKTVKDILSNANKVLILYGKGSYITETYRSMGLAVGHKDLEKPIQFTADYVERRNALQAHLEGHRTKWYAVASELGRAFGLREAERIASRDILVKLHGKLFATQRLGKLKEVSVRTLEQRYGKSFGRRLEGVVEGQRYLIVEAAKGGRERIQAINTPERMNAIERLHRHILSNPNHERHRYVFPDGTTRQQAERNFSRTLERAGATRDTQLHSHGDRHWIAQQLYAKLIAQGYSAKEAAWIVTREVGHDDPSKIRYYVAR